MLKAVLFDAYGTLISTGNGSVKASEKILALNGRFDISPTEFYARWKELHRQHIDSLEIFISEEEIFCQDLRRLYQEYSLTRDPGKDIKIMLDTLGHREAFPETKEVLQTFQQGYITAVASTTDTKPLLQDLSRNHLEFSYVFTSESLRVYKPEKAFYEKILLKLALSPAETLFVGDSLADDIQGPQSIGMKACWVNRKGVKPGNIAPDFEIQNLRQLWGIIENWE